jgi:SNF2 family DNA or RNA helicase
MEFKLQITYIPHLDEQGSFFIWLTQHDDEPVSDKSGADIRNMLTASPWSSFFMMSQIRSKNIVLEHGEEHIEVEGLLVPMWKIFLLLQRAEMNTNDEGPALQLGESFTFWQRIARSLDILIQQGHYYPTLLTIEKEDKTYAFAHWMLSRQTLDSLDLINEWLRAIPPLVFSAVDLAPFPIRQWMNVLLDTWTDQLLRNLLESTYAPHIEEWPKSRIFHRLVPQWFYYLMQKNNSYFLVTSKKEQVRELKELGQEIEEWHHPLVQKKNPTPSQTLIKFKKDHMKTFIEPLSLLICLEPLNENDPFGEWSSWDVRLKVKGTDGESISIYTAEEIWFTHAHLKKWLENKIDSLLSIEDYFEPLFYQKYQGDFLLEWWGNDVVQFYQYHAAGLEEHDIELQFPSWLTWTSLTNEKVDIYLETAAKETSLSLASIIQFNWRISIGDLSLPVSEFLSLVKQKQRFLQHQGEWVELPLEQMMHAFEEMNDIENQFGKKKKMSDLLQLSISEKTQNRKHLHLNVHSQADHYLQMLLEKPINNADVPPSLQGELRPYQKHGYTWLSQLREKGVGGCLADDMGLGKTIQAIAYLLQIWENEPSDQFENPALIICPTSLIGNWQRELRQFAPDLKVYAHHGPERYDSTMFKKNRASYDVIISSYAIVSRDASWLMLHEWPILILDEAQAIKNPSTKQSQIIRGLKASHRLALTGTPMENRLDELWSIMDFLNPGYLGSLRKFRQQFITPIEKHQDQLKSKLLKKLVQPFLLRRVKTDSSIIQDLPDKVEKKELCYLSTEQASLYQSVVDELMYKMRIAQGMERKGLILATLTRLKQICDHPYLILKDEAEITHSGKLERFFELLEPLLEQNQSALVFTQYVGMGELLQRLIKSKYKDCPVYFLHGGISSIKRDDMIESFRLHSGEKAIFILSLKAGGVGLNLTEANHVIHYDRWWNPAVEDQATDRAYRIGQKKNVHVYKLISEGTLEEGIDHLIEKKRNLTDQIIGQGDGWVTELSDEEVYDLIRLRERVIS